MLWADRLPWGSERSASLGAAVGLPTSAQGRKAPDMAAFRRQAWDLNDLTGQGLLNIAMVGAGFGPYTSPSTVPWEVLDAMAYDPVIYFGEKTVTSVADDPGLYYVKHKDPGVAAEAQAWLDPIMRDVVRAILPAFTYGASPVVMDFERRAVAYSLDNEDHVSPERILYSGAHSVWPGDVQLRVDPVTGTSLRSILHGRYAYEARDTDRSGKPLARRAFLPIWDRQFGRWSGMGSRRRAYKAWFTADMVALWQGRYLERSVDVPRIGYAPKGEINVNGEDVPAMQVLVAALMSLKNGSACALPSELDVNGNKLWDVDLLNLPDRTGAWLSALGYWDIKKLEATLTPPGLSVDALSGAKVADGLLRDFVQGVADFVAAELTVMVQTIHRLNGGKGEPPVVLANEIPQARRKVLLEVLKAVVNTQQHTKDGRVYMPGELVDAEQLLKQLKLPGRSVEEAAHEPAVPDLARGNGPPKDTTSDRDARREAARTDSGEDATGKPGEGED